MILTTQTDYIGRKLGDLAAVDILADAGFDALDYTMTACSIPTPIKRISRH